MGPAAAAGAALDDALALGGDAGLVLPAELAEGFAEGAFAPEPDGTALEVVAASGPQATHARTRIELNTTEEVSRPSFDIPAV